MSFKINPEKISLSLSLSLSLYIYSLNIFISKTAHYNILITQLHKEIGSKRKLIAYIAPLLKGGIYIYIYKRERERERDTTLAGNPIFSRKYFILSMIYTDEGGIK